MSKYHKYVFDTKKRKFIGKFEKMYQNESKEVFDSWHQEDSRQLQRKINLSIQDDYNFNYIIDMGCGKGSFTHLLKKRNNAVMGLDISSTAINIAKERFPDINFRVFNVCDVVKFDQFLASIEKDNSIDLVFTSELFSYLENWKEVLKIVAKHTLYFLITLYIPDNPIGFVKSEKELILEIENYFVILEHVSIRKSRFTIAFCRKK